MVSPTRSSSSYSPRTTTDNGLTVTCDIDANNYPKGIKISDAEMKALNIRYHIFHEDWNYTISPIQPQPP